MFDRVPGVIVLSEPWTLHKAHNLHKRGIVSKEQYHDMVRALVKLTVKDLGRKTRRWEIEASKNRQQLLSRVEYTVRISCDF